MDSRIFRAFPFGDGASNQWVAFLLMLMGTQTQRELKLTRIPLLKNLRGKHVE